MSSTIDPKEDNSNVAEDLTPDHNKVFVIPLIRVDGHFDELNEGYKLALVTLSAYAALSAAPVLNYDHSTGSTTLVLTEQHYGGGFLDITTGTQVFDVNTDLDVAGLLPGSILQIRKVDTGSGSITYTDNAGIVYNFVAIKGEFITLLKTPTTLRVI